MKKRRRKKRQVPKQPARPRRRVAPWVLGILTLTAGALGVWSLSPRVAPDTGAAAPASLNVLLITADTTRADYLGCYGGTAAQTPQIDRLAREGTRFARCATCTPLTLPSHCTLLTGTYPFVHRVRQNGMDRLGPSAVTLAETLKNAGFTTHAVVGSFVLDSKFGLSQGFETYSDVTAARGTNPAAAERKGNEVCDAAIARLRAIASRRFFLWAHFYDPHYPYESKRMADTHSPQAYADEITFMDAQIGRLMGELRNLQIADKTLVVLVGDHGEGLGQHDESEHGYFLYETAMHVPLIVWCPGTVPSGRVVNAQVRTVDIVPTILDYVGQTAGPNLQGTSLRALIAGKTEGAERAAYGESLLAHAALGLSVLRCITEDGWKYILSTRPELYHLAGDPAERDNLFSAQPERAARMQEHIRALLAGAPSAPNAKDEGPDLTQADAERLAVLGYAATPTEAGAPAAAGSEQSEPAGDSPALHPATIEQYIRAHELMSKGQYADAEGMLREVVRALPQAPEPRYELARALRRLNRGDEIFDVCREVLAASPDATELRLYYGRQLEQARRLEDARAQFEIVVAQQPQHAEARCELADALRGLGRDDEARTQYEQALKLDARNSRVLHGLAILCVRQGRLAEAADFLRRAIAIDPNSALLKRDLQRVLEDMKR